MGYVDANWVLSPGHAPLAGGQLTYSRETGLVQSISAGRGSHDAPGTWILTPGLINAHTHLELYRDTPIPIQPQESFADWILNVIAWQRPRTDEEKRQACHQSVLQLIRGGVTCVNDISSTGVALDVLAQVGMRGIVSLEYFHPWHQPTDALQRVIEAVQALKARHQANPLLGVGVSPHAPYNVSPAAYRAVVEALAPIVVHTHLAESQAECDWLQCGHGVFDAVHQAVFGQAPGPAQTGQSPAVYLADLLSSDWILAHGVHLDEADLYTVAQSGASMVTCPLSNVFLTGQTIANWSQRAVSGVVHGVGTDSMVSNHQLDLRAELRALQAVHGLSAQAAFELATAGSAQAIKQAGFLGTLAQEAAADWVLWYVPESAYAEDPYDMWLAPETEVCTVCIGGRLVMERTPEALEILI